MSPQVKSTYKIIPQSTKCHPPHGQCRHCSEYELYLLLLPFIVIVVIVSGTMAVVAVPPIIVTRGRTGQSTGPNDKAAECNGQCGHVWFEIVEL